MRDKGSHFPDVESKRNTTTVQRKNHGGLGRERFQRLISRQLEKGCDRNGGCCSAWLFPFALHEHTHAHTENFGVWVPDEVEGKAPLPLWGSDVSLLQALRFPSVEMGDPRLKSIFKLPSTSAVVTLEFGECGDRDTASTVWLLRVLYW